MYPNLGVVDAYATVRRGDTQWSVRCSDAMDERPLDLEVGPYKVEVIEPLKKLRLICDADDHGHRLRPHLGRLAPRGDGAGPPHAQGHAGDPRRVALRPARVVGGRAAGGRRGDHGGPRDVGRLARPLVGHPSGRRTRDPRPPRGRSERGPLVALRADPLRRPLGDHHLPGEPGRVPHAQRRHPRLGRRPGRPAGLARGRDRLHVRHPHPGAGPHPPHRARRQGLRHGGGEPRLRRPAPRRRLRRRQRLDPRPVARARLGGGEGLRPHHPPTRRPASPSA